MLLPSCAPITVIGRLRYACEKNNRQLPGADIDLSLSGSWQRLNGYFQVHSHVAGRSTGTDTNELAEGGTTKSSDASLGALTQQFCTLILATS